MWSGACRAKRIALTRHDGIAVLWANLRHALPAAWMAIRVGSMDLLQAECVINSRSSPLFIDPFYYPCGLRPRRKL